MKKFYGHEKGIPLQTLYPRHLLGMRFPEAVCHFSAFESRFFLALVSGTAERLPFLGALKLGWVNVKLAVFRREVPAPHGSNLVFPGPK